MNKKQKKMLWRIIVSAVLMVALHFVPVTGLVRLALHTVPYFIVGYDILWKAVLGIWNRQVFDENFLMAVATSIDALAVGISLAMAGVSNIFLAVLLIGVTTFVLSAIGVRVGNVFGSRYEKKAELMGGVILILLGVKILLEHLGVI